MPLLLEMSTLVLKIDTSVTLKQLRLIMSKWRPESLQALIIPREEDRIYNIKIRKKIYIINYKNKDSIFRFVFYVIRELLL